MNTLKTTFFEDPLAVYIALGIAAGIIVVAWYAGARSPRRLVARLLVVAVLAGATYTVQKLVVTDREQIRLALYDIADSIANGRVEHAMTHVDDKYIGWGRGTPRGKATRAAMAAAVNAAVQKYHIKKITYLGPPKVEVDGLLANCKLTAVIVVDSSGSEIRSLTGWKLRWIKRDEGWRIEYAERTQDVLP